MTGPLTPEGLAQALRAEGARLLDEMRPDLIDKWVSDTASEVLAGRVLSAGPTRSGSLVQVRFRLGKRLSASSHQLASLRDERLEFVDRPSMRSRMAVPATESVTRAAILEKALSSRMMKELADFYRRMPPSLTEGTDRSTPWRTSDALVREERVRDRLMAVPGVLQKTSSLVEDAITAVLAVPYDRFPDAGRRTAHLMAKKALLKAMKVALIAGVTDEELEDIKNEALVNQVMS